MPWWKVPVGACRTGATVHEAFPVAPKDARAPGPGGSKVRASAFPFMEDRVGKKYVICPGWVESQTDGDRHFIGAARLMQLYGVSPAECFVERAWPFRPLPEGLIPLGPRYRGDYTLPTQ